jgi:hypothetical protein
MHLPDIVEHLESLDTCSIDCDDLDYANLCQISINCFRILNQTENEVYTDILSYGIGDETISIIAEEIPSVREELLTVQNLQILYEKLRLMKLEGKVYEILDEFFNANLYRTL